MLRCGISKAITSGDIRDYYNLALLVEKKSNTVVNIKPNEQLIPGNMYREKKKNRSIHAEMNVVKYNFNNKSYYMISLRINKRGKIVDGGEPCYDCHKKLTKIMAQRPIECCFFCV